MADALLDVVNENDEVIGRELRSIVHANGLLHREIHLWLITPDKKIVMQQRSIRKETNPGLLTLAAGGHVESGSTYAQTALIELEEETGQKLLAEDVHYFRTYRDDMFFPQTNVHNVAFRAVFGAVFRGKPEDLRLETGDSDGFFFFDVDELVNPSPELKQCMQPRLLEEEFASIRDKLLALIA